MNVRVAKLVDAHDSGSCVLRHVGSSPVPDIFCLYEIIKLPRDAEPLQNEVLYRFKRERAEAEKWKRRVFILNAVYCERTRQSRSGHFLFT